MKLKFINHASVLIDCDKIKILTDPWYSGTVFNDGWSLMCEKGTDINSLDFNYLWYSHEHPDHFNLQELEKISEDRKRNITILFQYTPDQKVKSFCEMLGYTVFELENEKEYKLGDCVITCGQEGGFDSWLSVKFAGKHLLNINDCRIETPEEVQAVYNLVGKPDVLLTQFGWANWVGNPGDVKSRKIARKMVFDRSRNQIEYLDPTYVMPFASYSWFSHSENQHCNEQQVTLREFVDTHHNSNIVPLFLDEEWMVGEPYNNGVSLAKWDAVFLSLIEPKNTSSYVSFDILIKSFNKMCTKLEADNDLTSLQEDKEFVPTIIELTDYEHLQNKILFDSVRSLFYFCDNLSSDVKMSSQSLQFLMNNAWGRGTLTINGRFKANYKTFRNFLRQTCVYYNNNIGKIYPKDITKEEILSPKSFVYELIEGAL
jgi:UDP-MurNAc hydroxylase